MAEKKLWRDVIKVHPAADVFPMLPGEELRKLGDDIVLHGLRDSIAIWRADDDPDATGICLIDGRNRLAALELHGNELDPEWPRISGSFPPVQWIRSDPKAYIISKNLRGRHLTKEQQADLIVKVMNVSTDLANLARSFSPTPGERGGSTKDPIKKKRSRKRASSVSASARWNGQLRKSADRRCRRGSRLHRRDRRPAAMSTTS